jgi:hypothetical protein
MVDKAATRKLAGKLIHFACCGSCSRGSNQRQQLMVAYKPSNDFIS